MSIFDFESYMQTQIEAMVQKMEIQALNANLPEPSEYAKAIEMAAAGLTGPNPTAIALEAVQCPKGDESVSLGSDFAGFFDEDLGEVEVQLEEFDSQVVENADIENDITDSAQSEVIEKQE